MVKLNPLTIITLIVFGVIALFVFAWIVVELYNKYYDQDI